MSEPVWKLYRQALRLLVLQVIIARSAWTKSSPTVANKLRLHRETYRINRNDFYEWFYFQTANPLFFAVVPAIAPVFFIQAKITLPG